MDEFYCSKCDITTKEEKGYLNSKCPKCYAIIPKKDSTIFGVVWKCSPDTVQRKPK